MYDKTYKGKSKGGSKFGRKPTSRTSSRPTSGPSSRPTSYTAPRPSSGSVPRPFTPRPASKPVFKAALTPAPIAAKAPIKAAVLGPNTKPESPYPMRINKYVAMHNALTRRAADLMVEKGQVMINGKVAVLGDKVDEKDNVTLDTKDVQKIKHTYMYFAYNKPKGVLTHSPTNKDTDIKTALLKESSLSPHVVKQLFPIGRLDKKSEGLIILTNDGRLSDKLLNPEYVHEKEYVVTTNQKLPSYFQKSMEKGVNIGDYVTKPCTVELLGNKAFSIILTEGKKHQIRRMCEVMHTDVDELKRVRIMNIRLGAIAPNTARKVEGKPLSDFLKSLKLA